MVFRKYCDTVFIQSNLKETAKEMSMGHPIGLDDKYYHPTHAGLLEEYQKAVDNLAINKENRLEIKVKNVEDEKRYSNCVYVV